MVSASFVELDNFWSALTCQRFGLWRLAATSAHLIDPTYGRDTRDRSKALTGQRTPKFIVGNVPSLYVTRPLHYRHSAIAASRQHSNQSPHVHQPVVSPCRRLRSSPRCRLKDAVKGSMRGFLNAPLLRETHLARRRCRRHRRRRSSLRSIFSCQTFCSSHQRSHHHTLKTCRQIFDFL